MTLTLETFYRGSLALNVLTRERTEAAYLREVTLNLVGSKKPVEYGAIRIFLDYFPLRARTRVLEEESPLGKILATEGIPHIGWPQAFLRVKSDSHMQEALQLTGETELYGRRNVLLDEHRRMLAEVFEILAPVR